MQKAFENGLSSFYYLMICADGIIDDRELELGEKMIKHERIRKNKFYDKIEEYGRWDKKDLYEECVIQLKKCTQKARLTSVAWMSLVAKSDGFVSFKEEQLLNIISSNELKLELDNVLAEEKRLIRRCKIEFGEQDEGKIATY